MAFSFDKLASSLPAMIDENTSVQIVSNQPSDSWGVLNLISLFFMQPRQPTASIILERHGVKCIVDEDVIDNLSRLLESDNFHEESLERIKKMANAIIDRSGNNPNVERIRNKCRNILFKMQPTIFEMIPNEVLYMMLEELSPKERHGLARVCKLWCYLDKCLPPPLPKDTVFIGKKQWEEVFGAGCIGEVPLIPNEEYEALYTTHFKKQILLLMPEKVKEKPLNMLTLEELVKARFGRNCYNVRVCAQVLQELGKKSMTQTHWILITEEVIPESRNKSFVDQKEIIKKIDDKYDVPDYLSTIVCAIMYNLRTGKYLLPYDPWTYTRCKETYDGGQVVVGGPALGSLYISSDSFNNDSLGVLALRKLF